MKRGVQSAGGAMERDDIGTVSYGALGEKLILKILEEELTSDFDCVIVLVN